MVTAQTVADVNTGLRGGMQLGQHSSCSCCHVSSLSWLGRGGGLWDGGGVQLGQHSSCCCCHVSSLSCLGRGGGRGERERGGEEGGGLAEECVLCVHTNKVAAPFQKKVLLWKTLNLTPIQPLTLLP